MEDGAIIEKLEFADVFAKYYPRIYAYILKRINNVHEAEDLANEVFYACLKSYANFDPAKASLATWLYAVTNNRLKNYYRDRKNIISINDEENPVELISDDDISNAIYLTEIRKSLYDALCILTEREQSIVILKYFKDYSAQETAQALQISSGNVRVILSRSLVKMRDYFAKNNISWDL